MPSAVAMGAPPLGAYYYPQVGRMELCVAPVAEHKAKQIGLCPGRRILSSSIVRVYPCATHGPDVVCAATAVADRATHLVSTRGKEDVGKA